jgi:hypothetical protein
MNSHSTQVLGLLVIVAWAALSARGLKKRLATLLNILAFMVGGLGIGFAIGSSATRGNAAMSWMILLGAVSGFVCLVRNRRLRTRRTPPSRTDPSRVV